MKSLLDTAFSKKLITTFLFISCLLTATTYAADILPPTDLIIGDKPASAYKTYYIRTDGGTYTQCTGLADAPYPGSGADQACAVNHPFELFPPGGTVRIAGGDTVIIGSGSYRMGYTAGAYDSGSCSSSWPWDCHLPAVPSGPDSDHPTRILGEGWDTETGPKPELYGVERAYRVIDLSNADNVEIQYLDITDHASCVNNGNHADMACNRSTFPYGDWADTGIYAKNSANVLLKNVDVHGLTSGIHAGGLTDWTVEKVTIRGNGMIGWDGDTGANSSNSGTQTFTDLLVEWNGCIEQYQDKSIAGCWGQTSGGYGDGFGTASTGGNWVFTDSQFLHNTSDGLDLLYNDGTGTTTITRVHSEGNAGNALKISGDTTVTNSVLIGNCNYFTNSNEETGTEYVDDCRAMGNTIAVNNVVVGGQFTIINSTITGEGDVLIQSTGDACDGTENLLVVNSILKGDEQAVSAGYAGELASYYYAAGSAGSNDGTCLNSGFPIQLKDSIVYNVKETNICPNSDNILCSDPVFSNPVTIGHNPINVTLQETSPAINRSSSTVGSTVGSTTVPATDYLGATRPDDGTIDWGAYSKN